MVKNEFKLKNIEFPLLRSYIFNRFFIHKHVYICLIESAIKIKNYILKS